MAALTQRSAVYIADEVGTVVVNAPFYSFVAVPSGVINKLRLRVLYTPEYGQHDEEWAYIDHACDVVTFKERCKSVTANLLKQLRVRLSERCKAAS